MQFAMRRWPQLEGKLIPVSDEGEMVNILMNYTDTDSVCSSYGRAGGKCYIHICTEL